jgi:hypothetical protein
VPSRGVFDPYQLIGGIGFVWVPQLSERYFKHPGTYRLRFVYSTAEPNIEQWLGDLEWHWKQGKRDPHLLQLFEQVPKTTVRSNEIVIQVIEPQKSGQVRLENLPTKRGRSTHFPQDGHTLVRCRFQHASLS